MPVSVRAPYTPLVVYSRYLGGESCGCTVSRVLGLCLCKVSACRQEIVISRTWPSRVTRMKPSRKQRRKLKRSPGYMTGVMRHSLARHHVISCATKIHPFTTGRPHNAVCASPCISALDSPKFQIVMPNWVSDAVVFPIVLHHPCTVP